MYQYKIRFIGKGMSTRQYPNDFIFESTYDYTYDDFSQDQFMRELHQAIQKKGYQDYGITSIFKVEDLK